MGVQVPVNLIGVGYYQTRSFFIDVKQLITIHYNYGQH